MRHVQTANSGDDAAARELDARILDFIAQPAASDDGFTRLALDVFAYQYERNAAYRSYCDRLGRTPDKAAGWQDPPPVPTASFSEVRLACFPPQRTALRFTSSGTTSAGARSSVHELEDPSLYDASLLAHFRAMVLPGEERMDLIALSPPFAQAPNSSLSYMISKLADALMPGAQFFIRDGELDAPGMARALRSAQRPVLIFGTAFAFVHFFDWCTAAGARFRLPPGSRVVDTGGFKGKAREIARDELYAAFSGVLGVPRDLCVSEYGMCELCSQWYDATIADMAAGRAPRRTTKRGPHWTRFAIVDPVTAQPLADGQRGLLQVFDLANRGSVSAVLTADEAVAVDGGFELIGRHRGAPPKGCSIAVDALLGGSA